MKLYVFYFSRVTKEVVRDEVEVEDKPKSYKTPAGYCLPYLEVSKFLKANTNKIYHDAFYRSCFKYTTPTGTVMVP